MSKHIHLLSDRYRRVRELRLVGPVAQRLAPLVAAALETRSGATPEPSPAMPPSEAPPPVTAATKSFDDVEADFKARRWKKVVDHLAHRVDRGKLPELWFANLAIAYCGLDRYDEAEDAIRAGWAAHGRTRMLDIEWAQIALKRHAAIEAVDRFEKIIVRNGDETPARVYLGLATAQRLRSDHPAADRVLEEGRRRRPESGDLDLAWAAEPTHNNDWAEAIARHRKLIDGQALPEADLFLGLENAHRRQGDLRNAIEATDEGLVLWPGNEGLVRARADLAMAVDDWPGAVRWWENLVQVSTAGRRQHFELPETGPLLVWFESAWSLIAQRWEELVADWKTPPSAELFIALTHVLSSTRAPEHAVAIAERGLGVYPLSANLRHARRLALLANTKHVASWGLSGVEPDPSLWPLNLDRQMLDIDGQFTMLKQPAPSRSLPGIRLLEVQPGTALEHYIRAGHHYDTVAVDQEIRALSEAERWPEMTDGTPPVERRARRLAKAYVRRHPRPPVPASFQAEAVFRLLYAELCVFEPVRRLARELARQVGDKPVFVEVSTAAPTYLSFFTATEMGQIYLYSELRRHGVNAYVCRFSPTAGVDEERPSFALHPNPAVCWSRPQSFVDDRIGPNRAVVPAGIRSVKRVIAELDEPLVYSSGQIVQDFAYDRSMNSSLELGASFIPHRSEVPVFDHPLTDSGGIHSRSLTGDGGVIRTPVLVSESMGDGWLDLLDRALGPLIDRIRTEAERQIDERGLRELHLADALYLESSVFAAAMKAVGGQVVLWPHSANPADAESRASGSFDRVVAVTKGGCDQWSVAHPEVEVVHNSALMLAPPTPPTFDRRSPVSVVVIGGRNVVGLMPLVDQSAHEHAYRRLFTQLDELSKRVDLNLYYKPKGRRGETEMWLDGLLDGSATWGVVEEHPLRMDLPNMIFVTVSCGSSAILEGIGRGAPGLMVSETSCRDYTTVDAKVMRSDSVEGIVELIERCCDPTEYLALIEEQQAYYRAELAEDDHERPTVRAMERNTSC